MNTFTIPKELKEKLDENRAYAALVNKAINDFSFWLARNKTIFFTEYTDHSLNHIENVLETANNLIREQCQELITPADVATLILSTLLHDSAMHIDIDGFVNLVQSEKQQVIEGFDDKSWKVLWLDFLAESRRFSGRKLMALFGDTDPVRHPPMNSKDMNQKDLLLCGEFLRRHHSRLAHEIAIFGVPGYSENNLKFEKDEDIEHIIDLAGVIARSHGLSIRDCLDYLKNVYSNVKLVRGAHPVFIMTLLRVADILQIQSNRAPYQIQKVSKFSSPVSLAEWEMHQAIKDVVFNDPPETILIVAEPKNVKTYLRIRGLLDQIQNELDNSWTIIGEVYSYDSKFREFGLTIRRIRSNIDNLEDFSKRVPYLPVQASFEVADTDLLKLLIAPLYGDDPSIGIRELLQNALDAVRELKEYQRQRPNLEIIEFPDHEGDVLVSIDRDKDGKWWISISDKGIGMTPDILRDYFLKAGASLRRSEIWKTTFEDNEGKSLVLRSGRFGIGALATFLLGDEMHISTRHITDQSGYGVQFQSKLDTESIEFQKVKRPIGTKISVQINDEIKSNLEKTEAWNWYFLNSPVVIRMIDGQKIDDGYFCPNPNEILPPLWHRISHHDYADIQWTYDGEALFVNGILVYKEAKVESERARYSLNEKITLGNSNWGIEFILPQISVFDYDAKLPLNLQRTKLTVSDFPFNNELVEDIIRDYIAYCLVYGPAEAIGSNNEPNWYFRDRYKGSLLEHYQFQTFSEGASHWYSTQNSFGLNAYWNLQFLEDVDSSLLISSYVNRYHFSRKKIFLPKISIGANQLASGRSVSVPNSLFEKIKNINRVLYEFMEITHDPYYFGRIDRHTYMRGMRFLVSKKIINLISDADNHSEYSDFQPFWKTNEEDFDIITSEEWSNEDWILFKFGDCGTNRFDFIDFAKNNTSPNEDEWPCIIGERYYLNGRPTSAEQLYKNIIEKAEKELEELNRKKTITRVIDEYKFLLDKPKIESIWMELLGSPVIPFDINERHKKHAYAYKELRTYIEAHETMKKQIQG